MLVPIPENISPLDSLLPSEPLLMMGAGPVPIPARVAAANSIVINHLGETMGQVVEQVKAMSHYVFQSDQARILGVAGPGSAAMEMAVANLVEPGDKVLSICNGYFSNRLAEMSERVGGQVTRLEVEGEQAVSIESVKQHLHQHRPTIMTVVQGETSNTVCNHSLSELCKIAKENDCLIIVDAVCTLSTMPLCMQEWDIDAVITGGQKGLSSIPGVSLVAFSPQAWQRIKLRKSPMAHWCLDAKLADKFWYDSAYHYTAPVSGVLALHEALRLICSESLPTRFSRHTRSSSSLQAGIEAMGLTLHVKPEHRLHSVVGIALPANIEGATLLSMMSSIYRVEISGSFGAHIVRIGQMGEQSRAHNIFRTLHALGASLKSLGADVDVPAGVSALEESLELFDQRAALSSKQDTAIPDSQTPPPVAGSA